MIKRKMQWFVIMFGLPVEVRNVEYSAFISNRWEKRTLVSWADRVAR